MTTPTASPDRDPFAAAPRNEVIGGSVTTEEKSRILQALAQAGFRNMSEGVREILFAFLDSAEVRDVVGKAIRRAA
jgi:hypothetical protein